MANDPPTDEEVAVFVAQFCLVVLGLFIPVLSYFCLWPNVNNAEKEFLRRLAWRELGILVVYPWIALLALTVIQLVPFPLFWFLGYLKFFTILHYHGSFPLIRGRRYGWLQGGMRYGKICKVVLLAYFVLSISLIFVLVGLFGSVWFSKEGEDDFSDSPGFPGAHYKINEYGAILRVKMVSSSRASDAALLVIHFWVWQQLSISVFRWRTYLWFFLSEVIDNLVEYAQREYNI